MRFVATCDRRHRLEEIDWGRSKFLVHSPKTEHHQGGDSRWVPIFPELKPHLEAAYERAEPGQVYVLAKYRGQRNLRTRFRKIIKRAGLKPWPKLFQNLRSTRQTELAASNPLHLVCAWLGNKAAVAQEHYLQVTDQDFSNAAKPGSAPHALHNGRDLSQLEPTDPADDGKRGPVITANVGGNGEESAPSTSAGFILMGDEGFEPTTSTV